MSGLIGVTGATGAIGGRVARRLAVAGARQRLVVRDPTKAPDVPGSEIAVAAYDQPEALRRAFDGVDALLFVSAAEDVDRFRLHRNVVDAAAAAGVGRIVYTSFAGNRPDSTFTLAHDHFHTEEALKASGVGWTMLQDNLYADFLPFFTGPDGVMRAPAGDGRAALVARDDVAEVAALVLPDASHVGRSYRMTGPEALSFDDAAALLTELAGREIRYEPETEEEAYASRAHYGAPDWEVRGWVTSYLAIANGELADVSPDVERLTGHPATSARELLTRHPQLLEPLQRS